MRLIFLLIISLIVFTFPIKISAQEKLPEHGVWNEFKDYWYCEAGFKKNVLTQQCEKVEHRVGKDSHVLVVAYCRGAMAFTEFLPIGTMDHR